MVPQSEVPLIDLIFIFHFYVLGTSGRHVWTFWQANFGLRAKFWRALILTARSRSEFEKSQGWVENSLQRSIWKVNAEKTKKNHFKKVDRRSTKRQEMKEKQMQNDNNSKGILSLPRAPEHLNPVLPSDHTHSKKRPHCCILICWSCCV